MPEAWQPSKAKMFLVAGENSVTAYVDTGFPTAWRNEPYYSELKRMAISAAPDMGQVCVTIGRNKQTIVILPDTDTDLGEVTDDERIVLHEHTSPSGRVQLRALKMRHDDPRLAGAVEGQRHRPQKR